MPDNAVAVLEKSQRENFVICMTQFLDAASAIHTAMCRMDRDSGSQALLNTALNAVLVGAQQCRLAINFDAATAVAAIREDEKAKAA